VQQIKRRFPAIGISTRKSINELGCRAATVLEVGSNHASIEGN